MKRKLRPSIKSALRAFTILLGILLLGINDFNMQALPLIIILFIVEVVNIKILENF